MTGTTEHATSKTGPLSWLADAPLFIDASQVEAFYDAIVKPESESGTVTISVRDISSGALDISGSASGKISTSSLMSLFPFLSIKGKIEGSIIKRRGKGRENAETVELHPIKTPQRQLVQLALHYSANHPHRVLHLQDDLSSADQDFISDSPRGLGFIDLASGAKLLPVASELPTGEVVKFFDEIKAELESKAGMPAPSKPDEERHVPGANHPYWDWHRDNFKAMTAVYVLERKIAAEGRPRWVDYRILAKTGRHMHIRVYGRGLFDTGIHAYNLIRGSYKYGIRLVGTLHSGPGLNVLAAFEK